MRYVEFSFTNFKGIDDMRLALSGDVTTLIGLNESGKTTILEAIFCFSYGAEDLEAINPNLKSLRDPEKWIPISKRANFNDVIRISARVALDERDRKSLIEEMRNAHDMKLSEVQDELVIAEEYRFENSRYVRTQRTWNLSLKGTVGKQRNTRVFGARTPQWQAAVVHLKENLPRIWYFPNFLFELPERFELVHNERAEVEVRDRNEFYRMTFAQILSGLPYQADLDTHVVERLKSTDRADQRSLGAIVLDMGREITSTIFDGWNRIFGREPSAQEVQLDVGSDDDSPAYLELKIKGSDGLYDLSERSLGFRWFFMFLLMTSYQGERTSNSKPLFLLDEPASNLHSSAQAELLKSFAKLVDRCTLIYTTHSHHLIDLRWLDAAYVVKNSALDSVDVANYFSVRMGSKTSISAIKYRQFVAEHPEQQSYFQPVLDLLDYRPSILEPTPSVVLVEGKSDFYLLRYMIDVMGVNRQLRTVPGGGAGSLTPLIRLHIGWGTSFVVLLDADAEGKKQRDRYESEFGSLVRRRCVLLSDACGDATATEAEKLLSDADRRALIDAVHPASGARPTPKKALRNALIELYAKGEAVAIETTTIARFSDLIDFLNERLNSA